ncbi:MAG: hypothetical protein ACFCAD_21115 [Pleurocapsa sp.]
MLTGLLGHEAVSFKTVEGVQAASHEANAFVANNHLFLKHLFS